uniref:Xylulose kinase-1 n=1 Tax=Tanacetum cinerariifolium TaxID=118510 RepID=A0A6L2L7V2_TANCI|nr:hypothetical protein [Tanacetum cinerariifolium]
MVAYLTKSDASEGFNQIINFLNGSSIKYALTVNPNIYVSCIKQFWTTVAVKKVNDVTSLQALVDKKKVVVTEATIRDALRLDNEEHVECLPNEEIFAELARMGNEKPSTKFTFYNAFFSSQKQVGDLSTHTIKYTSPALTQKVFANMRRVSEGVADEVHDEGVPAAGIVAEGDASAANDVVPTADEEPSILSPTPPTPSPQPSYDIPSTSQVQPTPSQSPQAIDTSDDVSNQGRMIVDIDVDVDVVLEEAKDVTADAKADQDADEEESEPAKFQEVMDIVTTAKIVTVVVTAADVPIPTVTTTAALTLTAAPSRRTKGVVIRDPEESTTTFTIIHSEAKSKDKERRYPLIRFTLDQMLNNVRLKVEVESEVSLELLRIQEKHSKCLMLLVKDLVQSSQDDAVD